MEYGGDGDGDDDDDAGRGYGGGGRERLYTYCYTVTTRMTPALRWAAKRAMFHVSLLMREKVTRPCPQTTNVEEK